MSQADPTDIEAQSLIALFNAVVRDLRVFLRRTLRAGDDADDIVQEAMLRVWRARETVDLKTARPLLFRIAANLAVDRLREAGRWRFTAIDDRHSPPDQISAERIIAGRQELAVIRAAIDTLPKSCRTAFVQSRIEGRRHADIAAEMGISTSMVEKHVAEAVFRLSLARRARQGVT